MISFMVQLGLKTFILLYSMYFEGNYSCLVFFFFYKTGKAFARTVAETGEIQRLQKWEPAQRIPVRGNELAAFQLVQQVKKKILGFT